MPSNSIFSSIGLDNSRYDDNNVATNKGPMCHNDENGVVQHKASHAINKNMLTSKTARTTSDNKSKLNDSSIKNKKYQSYSTEFPNGLPFEDEFYRNHGKRRDKSVSSKSELSDYGSIENDSDHSHSHSLLPFEEEFACRRPSTEALYVDFSKPIARRKATNSYYSKSSITDFSSSNCSSNSSSNVAINNAHDYGFSSPNYVNSPDEVIVSSQPVVYVAVQWRSNPNGLNDRKLHRFDAV